MTLSDINSHQQEISARRDAVVPDYAKRWHGMIREWRAPRRNDAVWLTYSANYLFNTRGLKWAVDPVLLSNRVPEVPILDASQDLSDLDVVLLTHAHIDHVDATLWSQLGREPKDCWLTSHAVTVAKRFRVADDTVEVAIPEWYTETCL